MFLAVFVCSAMAHSTFQTTNHESYIAYVQCLPQLKTNLVDALQRIGISVDITEEAINQDRLSPW